jgi:hypothetical protein
MTTILIDCKKKIVYADKRGTKCINGVEVMEDIYPKILTYKDSIIVGSGDRNDILSFYNSYEEGKIKRPNSSESTVLLVKNHTDGLEIFVYKSEKTLFWYKWDLHKRIICDTFITAGSGSQYAHGAFEICGDGEVAIQVASKYDRHTGCEVDKYEFK